MPEDDQPEAPLPHSIADDHPELAARKREAESTLRPFSGQSVTHGLTEVPDSKVPGTDRSHVMGPQQAACDPVAAGLDVRQRPLTSQEDRVITRTGVIGSGARPANAMDESTFAVSDGSHAPAASDEESDKGPGPNSTLGGGAPTTEG